MNCMKYILLKPALCAVDMSDGSERAEYVPQKYVFEVLERPSRSINLMYEYHPNDKNWPEMGVLKNKRYERKGRTNGYFPYMGNDQKNTNCEPFYSIRDIRKYGQDVQLTMTFDLDIKDNALIQIAKDLRPFGELILRINHESNGFWFTFNKENSYKEVNDFFVRFHNILKQYAPNVKTNACFNGVSKGPNEIKNHMGEDELAPAFRIADILSFDFYHTLHWGWPDPAYNPIRYGLKGKIKKMERSYLKSNEEWWEVLYDFHNLMLKINNGREKDIYLGEANTDAELVGLEEQAQWIRKFYGEIKERKHAWLKGATYYQFRDRGGLGLEYEDDDDPKKGLQNPSLKAYREVIKDPYFSPQFEILEEKVTEPTLEWKSSTNAKGIYLEEKISPSIKKCFIEFGSNINLILKANETWFHKPEEANRLDISKALNKEDKLKISFFAPPPTGENTPAPNNPDYLDNYKFELSKPPKIDIR